MDLGTVLKTLRLQRNETLHKVAMGTDIDMTMLSKFEHNDRKPTEAHVKRLAEYFGVSAETLLSQLTADKILHEYGLNSVTKEALHIVMETFNEEPTAEKETSDGNR
jgi:transcriptional regulator with XRE-family HTH domain